MHTNHNNAELSSGQRGRGRCRNQLSVSCIQLPCSGVGAASKVTPCRGDSLRRNPTVGVSRVTHINRHSRFASDYLQYNVLHNHPRRDIHKSEGVGGSYTTINPVRLNGVLEDKVRRIASSTATSRLRDGFTTAIRFNISHDLTPY